MKNFSSEDVASQHQIKSSAQRVLRAKVLELYPDISSVIDEILPKKAAITIIKYHNHVQVASVEDRPVFFQSRDGLWIPSLRIIHQYPHILPTMQVDYGAIKAVLRGSNIMCPGLTSPDGWIQPGIDCGRVVKINAEGKHSACGIGIMKIHSDQIRKVNKGVCIEVVHMLGDGLWQAVIV